MERSARRRRHGSRRQRGRSPRHAAVAPEAGRLGRLGPRPQRLMGRGRAGLGRLGAVGQAEGAAAAVGQRHGLERQAGSQAAPHEGDGVELEAVPDACRHGFQGRNC